MTVGTHLVVPLDGEVKVVDVVAEGVVLLVDLGGALGDVLLTALLQVAHLAQHRHQLQQQQSESGLTVASLPIIEHAVWCCLGTCFYVKVNMFCCLTVI